MLSRRKSRILVVQSLYSWDMNQQNAETLLTFPWYEYEGDDRSERLYFARMLLGGIIEKLPELDQAIQQSLNNWGFERLGKVELAIMRLGAYELLYAPEIPRQVVINEAVEITNEFASPKTFRIINGVLDAIQAGSGPPKL